MLLAKAAIHPDQSESAWKNYMRQMRDHGPKIRFVIEIYWMMESAFLLGQDRFAELIESEVKKIMGLRASTAFVDLDEGLFSIPSETDRGQCMRLMALIQEWFVKSERILPRLRQMMGKAQHSEAVQAIDQESSG